MEDNVSCIKIKYSQPEVSRKNERPRLKWLESVSGKDFGSELLVKKAGNTCSYLLSENIIDAKANKGLNQQRKNIFQTLIF